MSIKNSLDSIWGNSIIKFIFAFSYYWSIPFGWKMFKLIFKYFPSIIIKKEIIFAVVLGFFFATIRSSWKKLREIRPKPKDLFDLLPSYIINYPIILSLIIIMGNYYCKIKGESIHGDVSFAILFVLGFFVDRVFDIDIKDLLKTIKG